MEEKKKSGLGTASLVLGIIGIVLSFVPIINNIAFILGVLSIIFGIVCLCKKASKGLAIAGLILGILACIITFQAQSTLSDAINEAFSGNTTENTKTSAQQKECNVGESVDTSKVKITFNSCKDYTNFNSYSKPAEGKKVIRAEFAFENISDSDIYLGSMECYSDDTKCETYYYADDYKSPTIESISSGKKFNAILYYEIPKDAQKITIEYDDNAWSNTKVIFNIK